ncbi:hypothetical protein BX666DRAFT_1923618 [Dichotomocladium elegans]|nr:hypothetical protein BX666DRAFT_1923618 [Dichotomocladium elegans]
MVKHRDASPKATAKPAVPNSQGVPCGQETAVLPEEVYSVTEDSVEVIKDHQSQKKHPVHYRILLAGASYGHYKDSLIRVIAEAIGQLYFESGREQFIMAVADLSCVGDAVLKSYLKQMAKSRSSINLVMYLFDNDMKAHRRKLGILDYHFPDTLTWPMLTHPSRSQELELTRHLATYRNIRTVKQSLILPDALLDNTPNYEPIFTTHYVSNLRPEAIAPALKESVTDTIHKSQKEASIFRRTVAITGILMVAIAAKAWKYTAQLEPETSILPPEQVLPTVHAELGPTWHAINEHTLEHPFEVLVDRGDNEDLTITVQANGIDLEYQMVYEPGSEFKYTATVPSPCLLDSDDDLEATIIWRSENDGDAKVEKVIDRVRLPVDICKPIQERRLREEKKHTAVIPLHALSAHVAWQLLIDNLISRTHHVAQVLANVWQTFTNIWKSS